MGDITVKKKSVLLISVISSILLGIGITAFVVFNNAFSFSNLTVDIGDSDGLGIGKIADDNQTPSRRKRQSTENSQRETTYDKLITVDSEGNVDILRFYNNDGNTVEIPFHAVVTENYGEFVYIVYSDWPREYLSGDLEFEVLFNSSFSQRRMNQGIGIKFNFEFIAIHKETGKVFDLKEEILDELVQEGTLGSSIKYLHNGFVFIARENRDSQTFCLNKSTFNSSSLVLNVEVICSNTITPFTERQKVLPNGLTYFYETNKLLDLNSLEFLDLTELDEKFYSLHLYIRRPIFSSSERISWTYIINDSEYIYTIQYKNGQTSFIETESEGFVSLVPINSSGISDEYYINGGYRNTYSAAPFYYINQKLWRNEKLIQIQETYPESMTTRTIASIDSMMTDYLLETNVSSPLILFRDNKVYLFLSFPDISSDLEIYEIDTVSMSANKILETTGFEFFPSQTTRNANYFLFGYEFYEKNPYSSILVSGNYFFKVIEGFSETIYKFNLILKEVFEESQSTPTFFYYDIKPIN